MSRRRCLRRLALTCLSPAALAAQTVGGPGRGVEPAFRIPPEVEAEVQRWTAHRAPTLAADLRLEIPELVDNGNDVPLRVAVTPGGAGGSPGRTPSPEALVPAGIAVTALAVWAPRNPNPMVWEAEFHAAHVAPVISTRIRLSTSQRLIAAARLSDGRILRTEVAVIVALAACVEG